METMRHRPVYALCMALIGCILVPAAHGSDAKRVVSVDQPAVLRDVRDGVVSIPAPDGGVERFRVAPMRVAAPELQRRYPENRVFRGEGIDDPRARVTLGTGPRGFHAQVLSPRGDWYVDHQGSGRYLTYDADARAPRAMDQQPPIRVPGTITPAPRTAASTLFPRSSGTELRTYRFALATTGEYSQVFGGTKPLVHAELVKAMARINGVYEAEVAARFELVPNNDDLIYLNSATDPYTNSSGVTMLGQNQSTVDSVIGSANYDLGHVFSTGGGGVAYLGVLGVNGYKAGGVTGMSNPVGDPFYIDYVAHEVGHQMGANHTFQGTQGACSGNGAAATAMEPGSGSTIMSYSGICGADDLQAHSDAYFHATSYDEMRAVMEAASTTGTGTPTGNSPPVITLEGAAYTVPPRTPLALAASATDPDDDALTYTWEQYNAGVLRALAAEPKTGGALFRSWTPVATGARYLPSLASVVAGTTNQATGSCAAFAGSALLACQAEFLPTTARSMTFRLTARDDAAGGGGVATDDVAVTVSGSTPFAVTSQATPGAIASGGQLAITWEVAGTAAAPYGVSGVDILASDDDGVTWEHTLAANTPNDGSHTVTLPALANGAPVRLMVRARDNIFYDVNDATLTATADVTGPEIAITTPANGAVYAQGQSVIADFACSDPAGVASCTGTVADGAPIATGSPGLVGFTVTAADAVGNVTETAHIYTVTAPAPAPAPEPSPVLTPGPTPAPAPVFGVDIWASRGGVVAGRDATGGRISAMVRRGQVARYAVHIANLGTAEDVMVVRAPGANRTWRVLYRDAAGRDITRGLVGAGWRVPVAAGNAVVISAAITPTTRVRRSATLARTVTLHSGGDGTMLDTITLRTTVRR